MLWGEVGREGISCCYWHKSEILLAPLARSIEQNQSTFLSIQQILFEQFPGGPVVKNLPANSGNPG